MIEQLWDEVFEAALKLHKRLDMRPLDGMPAELLQRLNAAQDQCCAFAEALVQQAPGQLVAMAVDPEVNYRGLKLAHAYASLVLEAARLRRTLQSEPLAQPVKEWV